MSNSLFPTEEEIPESVRIPVINQREYLINGEIRTWNGDMQSVLSPVCIRSGDKLEQKVLGSVPLLTEKEALEALDAASQAYNFGKGAWPSMTVRDRIRHVENFLRNMGKAREQVINLLMWEIGKSQKDATSEFDRTVNYIRETITALKDLNHEDSKLKRVDGHIVQARRAPYGKVLCVGPFNYPINEIYTTMIPALIMGNTVVFKPAKNGVLLHQPLLEAYQKSFPPGVINTIYGDGAQVIGPIMKSGQLDMLSFIGSTKVANIITKQHPKPSLHTILGLGAKNPAFVLRDANIDKAVEECLKGSLSYNGQRCTAHKIIYIHEDRANEFVENFAQRVDRLVWGMPWTPNVNITPLPEPGKQKWMQDYVDDAVSKGAKVVNPKGAQTIGTFYSPAVLFPINRNMKIYHEEQFGPVVPIVLYHNIEEALHDLEISDLGQQASIFGRSPKDVGMLVDRLSNQVCRVVLNGQCQRGPDSLPFTGRKTSAVGVLSITDALKVSSIRSMVTAQDNPENKELIQGIIENGYSTFMDTDYLI
jgi:glyceraldehyde-3-phosphate dehydrogenase (NADP+)